VIHKLRSTLTTTSTVASTLARKEVQVMHRKPTLTTINDVTPLIQAPNQKVVDQNMISQEEKSEMAITGIQTNSSLEIENHNTFNQTNIYNNSLSQESQLESSITKTNQESFSLNNSTDYINKTLDNTQKLSEENEVLSSIVQMHPKRVVKIIRKKKVMMNQPSHIPISKAANIPDSVANQSESFIGHHNSKEDEKANNLIVERNNSTLDNNKKFSEETIILSFNTTIHPRKVVKIVKRKKAMIDHTSPIPITQAPNIIDSIANQLQKFLSKQIAREDHLLIDKNDLTEGKIPQSY